MNQIEPIFPIEGAILQTMREAGEILLRARDMEQMKGAIEEKAGTANFVTIFDVQVQQFLMERFRQLLPEAGYLAEEEGVCPEQMRKGFCFVIDPIDGTTNFIHHYDCSVISVALLKDGEVYFGAVYNPYQKMLYSARKGQGAYCNGNRIWVSKRPLEHAVISVGTTPYYKEYLMDSTFEAIKTLYQAGGDIRRSGSAAFDLCMVASGRTEVFLELRLSPWDYAAGSLLVQEAGGKIAQPNGMPLRMDRACPVLASNAVNMEQVWNMMGPYQPSEELFPCV